MKVFVFMVISVLFSACNSGFFCITGEEPAITEELRGGEFDRIEIAIPGTVIIRKGEEHKVTLSGYENHIEEIDFKVEEGILVIQTGDCFNNHQNLLVEITTPDILELKSSGSGIITAGNFDGPDLVLKLSGSGDIIFSGNRKNVNVQVTGSGSILLSGKAHNGSYEITGSGDIQAFRMPVKTLKARVSGSGSVESKVDEELHAHISGSGDVRYRGNPAVKKEVDGSGEVKQDVN